MSPFLHTVWRSSVVCCLSHWFLCSEFIMFLL
jgi:hypothetical protein